MVSNLNEGMESSHIHKACPHQQEGITQSTYAKGRNLEAILRILPTLPFDLRYCLGFLALQCCLSVLCSYFPPFAQFVFPSSWTEMLLALK